MIAAGALGGGAVLVSLSWLEPVGFALIGIGVVGLIRSRTRASRTGCAGSETGGVRFCCSS
ncbi:hypothetical protein [Nocardia nepalensis]|uniref:hypothetical protein n=1 Tax=Nocardia nepalensis TaxID=3375448 RepID=UPI003B66DE95